MTSAVNRVDLAVLVVFLSYTKIRFEVVVYILEGLTLNKGNAAVHTMATACKVSKARDDPVVTGGGIFSIFYAGLAAKAGDLGDGFF